jgi:hypothetical protein
MIRRIWQFRGPLIYLASVIATVLTVEVLRSTGLATKYIEWTAMVWLVAALTDFGIPSALQWGLLSARPKNPPQQAETHSSYQEWIQWSVTGAWRPWQICGSMIAVIALVFYLVAVRPSEATLGSEWALLIASLTINVRKLTCAFLDGAGRFALARFIFSLPNFLILLHACAIALLDLPANSFNDMALAMAAYYGIAGIIGAIALNSTVIRKAMPTANSAPEQTSSAARWHVLSICSAAQSQLFFIIAPKSGASDMMVPVYYAQKAVQVSMEMVAQYIKEWCSNATNKLADLRALSQDVTRKASMIPTAVGLMAFLYSRPEWSLASSVLAAMIMLEACLATLYTCRGHIALMRGQPLPARQHLAGSIVQPLLSLLLVPVFGASGYYASSIATGALFSYKANQTIYRKSLSEFNQR